MPALNRSFPIKTIGNAGHTTSLKISSILIATWDAAPTQPTDRTSGRLLGAQLLGRHGAEIAKRIDTYATAISYGATVDDIADLDLSYTRP